MLQALDARHVHPAHGLRVSMLGSLLRRPRWVAGTVIGYLSFPFQLLALAHAPLVVVQPVHACGLLLLLVAGAVIFKERIAGVDRAGIAAIVVGLAVVAWGAPRSTDSGVTDPGFIAVTGVLLLLALGPYPVRERCGRMPLMLSAAFGFACANLAVKGFSGGLGGGDDAVAAGYLVAAGIGSAIGVLSQMTAFQRHRAVDVVPLTFSIPIFLPAAVG
ncbi:MAG: hypothetical protein ACRDNJ_03190, partial [Solirubrobacteraceae bacterium]